MLYIEYVPFWLHPAYFLCMYFCHRRLNKLPRVFSAAVLLALSPFGVCWHSDMVFLMNLRWRSCSLDQNICALGYQTYPWSCWSLKKQLIFFFTISPVRSTWFLALMTTFQLSIKVVVLEFPDILADVSSVRYNVLILHWPPTIILSVCMLGDSISAPETHRFAGSHSLMELEGIFYTISEGFPILCCMHSPQNMAKLQTFHCHWIMGRNRRMVGYSSRGHQVWMCGCHLGSRRYLFSATKIGQLINLVWVVQKRILQWTRDP